MSDRRSKHRSRKLDDTWDKNELTETLTHINDDMISSKRSSKDRHRVRDDDRLRKDGKDKERRRHDDGSSKHDSKYQNENDSSRHRERRDKDDRKSSKTSDRRENKKDRRYEENERKYDDRIEKRREDRERRDKRRERDDYEGRTKEEELRRANKKEKERERERRPESERSRDYNDDKHRRKKERETSKERRYEDDERTLKSHKSSRRREDDGERHSKRREEREHHSRKREDEREHKSKRREDKNADRKRRDKYADYDDNGETGHSRSQRREKESLEYDQYKEEKREKRRKEKERESRNEDDGEKRNRDKKDRRPRHKNEYEEESSKNSRNKHENQSSNSKANRTYDIKDKEQSNDAENEYDYDDDFENYESDFESENDVESNPTNDMNPEMSELVRAIQAENDRAASAQLSRYGSASTSERNASPASELNYDSRYDKDNSPSETSENESPMSFINFQAASKKSQSSKLHKGILKRMKDLRSVVNLDTVSFDMLDLEPVTEYNIYIKNFGSTNRAQVSTQCNDDNMDQEIQTEKPELNEKWSQHPPNETKACGDGLQGDQSDQDYHKKMMAVMQADSKKLVNFMIRSCGLIESLITEEAAWMSFDDSKGNSSLSFCEECTHIQTNLAYLQGRKVVNAEFSPCTGNTLIAVGFEPASKEYTTRLDRKGMVVVWNTKKPSMPEKVLVCDATPTCCCFSPYKPTILFIGTDDGCVLAYDLKEPSVYHQIMELDKGKETVLRGATYSTGCMDETHCSPIVTVTPVSSFYSDSSINQDNLNTEDSLNAGLAFQLASLEEAGFLCIWVVIESHSPPDIDTDYGLSPNGKVRLVKSLRICIQPFIKSSIQSPFRVSCVQFLPSDPNHFYIGSDTGQIIHMTQFSQSNTHQGGPKYLQFEGNSLSAVTSLDINPDPKLPSSLLLSGHADGSLQIFLLDQSTPVMTWPFATDGNAVRKCKWSTCRPGAFYVLDSRNRLYIWDLLIQTSGPIKDENLGNKNLGYFSLSQPNIHKDLLKTKPEIALIFNNLPKRENSLVEVHTLSAHFSNPVENEPENLISLLQSVL